MNSCGASSAPLGVAPAHQRLNAAQRAVRQLDLRLEVQQQLAAVDPAAQLGQDREPLEAVLIEVVLINDPVPARGLGPVERDIGVAQQRVDAAAMIWMAGDPDAGPDVQPDAANLHRLAQAGDHLLRHAHAAVPPVDRAQDERELVAAEARDHIAGTGQRGQTPPSLLQHRVAAAMPERLVELLEAVKPDDQHTDPAAGAIRPAQRLTERARQVHAVRQPGERIRARQLLVDDRLAAAELDRHQWDPQQREQPEVIVGGREDNRHKRDEHGRGPSVEGEIRAHRPSADRCRGRTPAARWPGRC